MESLPKCFAPWSSRPRDIIDRRTAAGVTITLTNANQFQPGTLTVARGTTLTWVNTGLAPHTVTDDASKAPNRLMLCCHHARNPETRAC